ncbi:MAG: MFS transporter [Campylobacterales bacterium]
MTFFQARLLSVSRLIGGFYFFYFAAVGVYIIFLPKLLSEAGYSPFEIGVLFSSGPIMRFLVPFLFVRFIHLSPRVFSNALIASLLSTLIFIVFHQHFWIALLSLAAMGVFWSLVLPFVEVMALELIGARYGNARLYGSIGFILTGLGLGHIALTFDTAMIVYVATIGATLIVGLLLASRMDKTPEPPKEGRFSFAAHGGFWAAIFLMQMSFGGFYNFFTIHGETHGMSLATISWLWTFGVVAEIAMFLWQKRVLHLSLLTLLHISMALTALRWAMLFCWPESVAVAFASQSLHAFSLALFHTAAISYIQKHYANRKLGQQFYLGIGYGLGGFTGSVVSGWVYGPALFLWMAAIALIGWLALFGESRSVLRSAAR